VFYFAFISNEEETVFEGLLSELTVSVTLAEPEQFSSFDKYTEIFSVSPDFTDAKPFKS
jgi:hypothetical protein